MKISLWIILISILMGAATSSLVVLWIFMELNILGALPIIRQANTKFTNRLKYFVSQALGAILIFISLVISSSYLGPSFTIACGTVGVLWKLGAFPFHLWFIGVAIDLDWVAFFLLSTAQKILPMLIAVAYTHFLIVWRAGIRVLLVVLGTFNQSNLKKIFIYSSIFSLSWMLISVAFFENMWLILLLIYSVALASIVAVFDIKKSNLAFGPSLSTINRVAKQTLLLGLLFLGGIPPFAGFLIKVLLLKVISATLWAGVMIFLVFRAVYVIFMYLIFAINIFIVAELFVRGFYQPGKTNLIFWAGGLLCGVDFFLAL